MADAGSEIEKTVPVLNRGVKLTHDRARDAWILNAPERVLVLDEIALEIVRRIDGAATIGDICDDLATAFDAPRETIAGDVVELLQDLSERGFVKA